jgi:hypothetical protein
MSQNQTDQQMLKDITRMGLQTAILLRGVMLQKVNEETLTWGLQELNPSVLMDKYFYTLIQDEKFTDLMNILHIVYSLEGQVDFQVREYGLDSLKDDLHEINSSLQRIGEMFDLEDVIPPV